MEKTKGKKAKNYVSSEKKKQINKLNGEQKTRTLQIRRFVKHLMKKLLKTSPIDTAKLKAVKIPRKFFRIKIH